MAAAKLDGRLPLLVILWALQVYTRTMVNAYMRLNTMAIYTLKYILMQFIPKI